MQTNLTRPTNTTSLIGKMLVSMIALTGAALANFPQPESTGPSGSPAFPQSFAPFDVSGVVSNFSANTGAPQIAEWTRANQPGDTMAITANDLTSHTGDAEGRDTHFAFAAHASAAIKGSIQRLDDTQVAVTLPSELPANDLYLMWPRNSQGYGAPVTINRAEAWWIGPDRVAAGETFSVFGRNLTIGNGRSYLYIEELNRWVGSASQNPYKADFVMPTDVATGTYTIWAHNGHGRELGWSVKKSVSVVNKVVWNGGVYNVKNYGAKGDGSSDDFGAIAAAVSAASSDPYSTVYFPAGTYRFAGRLPVYYKNKIRYLGDGMNQTVIAPHANHAGTSASGFIVYQCGDDVKFQDLTFEANQYGGDRLFYIRKQNRVELERVRFSQLKSLSRNTSLEVVDTHKANYIHFKDCEFILTGAVFYGEGTQIRVEGCDFYGLNDNNTIMASWGGEKLSIVGCTGQSYDNSDPSSGFGWAKGRFFHCLGTWGSTHEVYFGGNSTSQMTPRKAAGVDQNSGEQFMSEGENIKWRGNPSAATSTTVKLPGLGGYAGNLLTVMSGKGVGQTRELVSVASDVVTIDEPWRVIPDASSIIMVGSYTRRMVVYDNYLEGTDRAVQSVTHTAATGVEPYGGSVDWIVANNTMRKLRHGVDQFAIYKDRMDDSSNYVCPPHFFNEYKNNLFDGCREGINIIVIKEARGSSPVIEDISYLGVLYRNNTITNTETRAIQTGKSIPQGRFALTIFDNNDIHTKDLGVVDATGQENYVWIGNTLRGSGSGTGMLISDGHVPALRENVWSGFSSTYSGSTPGSVLELPSRTINVDSEITSAGIEVYNGGTASMNWTATSSAPWLSITRSGGTISDEKAEGQLAIEVNPALVPEPSAEAVVNVTAGGQSKQLTVLYNLDGVSPTPPEEPTPEPTLATIEISGPSSIDEGVSARFYCQANYSDGSSASVTPSWRENSAFASIAADGLLTAAAVDSDQPVTVSATFEGKSATFNTTVKLVEGPPPAPTLLGIAISGPSSINEGTSARFSCQASYSDGSTASVTPSWSENSAFASIAADGLLAASAVDSDQPVIVSATFEGESATFSATIKPITAALDRIEILGPTSLDEQTTAQMTCLAYYTDGATLSVSATWSENSGAAAISANGLFTAKNVAADNMVTVTASFAGKTDTHAVIVKYVPPALTALTILGPFTLDEGSSAQYSCVGTFADGNTAVVSPVWSENSAFITISENGLLGAGDVSADQSVLIAASLDGISVIQAVNILNLAAVVSSIEIAGPANVAEESSAQYTCEAVYSDGSRTPIAASWNVSGSASISSIGLLTTGNVGSDQTATITASYNGKTDDLSVTIQYVAPALTGVAVSGPRFVDEGLTASYNCVATYSDGTTQSVIPGWSLVSPFASVNASGVLMANDVFEDQDVQLFATFGGFQVNYLVTVKYVAPPVTLTELRITAPSALDEITEATVSCVAIYSDGSTDSVTPVWSVDAAFASIDAAGKLNVGNIDADGLLNVTATYSGVTETIAIDVSAVGTKAIYPLTGLEGKTVRARLWDEIGQTWHELGEMESPVELVVDSVSAGQWYWLTIEEYDDSANDWILVHANWISM